MSKKKEKGRKHGDCQKCFEMAKRFENAATQCVEGTSFPIPCYEIYPFTVNAALSCELYLKSIMMYSSENDVFIEGHLLDELFAELPEKTRKVIEEEYSKKAYSKFADMLERNRNAFAEWRYAFEDKDIVVEPMGLLGFMDVLRRYIERNICT